MKTPFNFFLIDDDTDDHEILNLAIRKIDTSIVVDRAFDGVEALTKLQDLSTSPHLILLDLNMPRMNGKQCLKAIRDNDTWKSIPVYIYSTSVKPELIDEIKTMGASGFIEKPAEIATLIQVLKDLMISVNTDIHWQQ